MSTPITDRVKNIQDVITLSKPTPEALQLINYTGTDPYIIIAKNSVLAALIADVLNEGKKPKPGYGWVPYFKTKGGFAFLRSSFDSWYTLTFVGLGSRLSFINKSLSDYAGKTFPEVYKPLTIK